jgi:hypothetical protein
MELSTEEKQIIVALSQQGYSSYKIAEMTGKNRRTIGKYLGGDGCENRKKTYQIVVFLQTGCFLYPSKFKRLRTVLEEILVTKWRLNWSVISPKLCLLSERSIRYIILSTKVIFSDETKIEIGNNRKVYVWRKVDDRLRPECNGLYQGRNYKTKFSVMVVFLQTGCFLYPSKLKRLRTVLEEILVTNWRLNWSVISPKLCLLSE